MEESESEFHQQDFDDKNADFFSDLLTPYQKVEQRVEQKSHRDRLITQTHQETNTKASTLAEKIKSKKTRQMRQVTQNEVEHEEGPNELAGSQSLFATIEWSELKLQKSIVKAVQDLDYKHPTKVQQQLVPVILSGKDVYASSCTGSGKTAAYLLPIIERFSKTKRENYSKVLVLLPTRELALQCYEQFEALNKYSKCTAALIIGAVPIQQQEAELRRHPDLIFATPGRMVDILKNSYSIDLQNLECLIFDEADRLMEMGFEAEVKEIVNEAPVDRQTILISATMSQSVKKLSTLALKKPVRIHVDFEGGLAYGLKQYIVRIRSEDQQDREATLLALLTSKFKTKTIIFVKTKHECHRIAMLLGFHDLSACELHGNLSQQQRLQAFSDFKEGKYNYLLATDLAARGLDIAGIKTVINFEIPFEVTRYIHRVGRTARIGSTGVSVTLCLENEVRNFKRMIKQSKLPLYAMSADQNAVSTFKANIQSLEHKIKAIIKEEIVEKEIRKAEVLATKAENIIEYHDEIMRKPKRVWINK